MCLHSEMNEVEPQTEIYFNDPGYGKAFPP